MTRVMHMSPLDPRQSGGLKGFGFTITFEPQAELTRPSVQSQGETSTPTTSFAGTEGDEGQHPHSNPACQSSTAQADEGSSNPQHPRAAPLYTSPEAPFHSITDCEDEDQ